MKMNFKKLVRTALAAVLALSLAFSMCGCVDNGSLMTVDGSAIRNGVYINYLTVMTQEARSKVSAESEDTDDTDSDSEEDFWQSKVEGKDVSEWIKEETLRCVRGHIGIQRLCEQYGISLTDEEISDINTQVNELWDTSDIYVVYIYGYNTYGEYYAAQGIGMDSLKELSRVNALRDKLFEYYYHEGGEYGVTEAEFNEFADENYVAIRIMEYPYTDYNGDELEKSEDIDAVKAEAQEAADRINGGEYYEQIRYYYEKDKAADAARKTAAAEYDEDNEEGLTLEEYVEQAASESTTTVPDGPDDYNVVLSKTNTTYTEDVTDFILSTAKDGKAYVYHSDEAQTSYVLVRLEMTDAKAWAEDNYGTVIEQMRGDTFNDLLEQISTNYNVEQNDYLVNKKYSPIKVDGYLN